ncbi:MAG: hypothetical protein ACLPV8_01290 [Steroidobacteraceae bacterium]
MVKQDGAKLYERVGGQWRENPDLFRHMTGDRFTDRISQQEAEK